MKYFFDSLVDSFGVHHHTDGRRWLKESGYSLDDAARGLISCLAHNDLGRAEVLFDYISRSRKGSDFYGFATSSGQFNTYPSSEDAKGQVAWALGYSLSAGFKPQECRKILVRIGPTLPKMKHIRGYAYALLGAIYWDAGLAKQLAGKMDKLLQNCTKDWYWLEQRITYANAIIPYSLLRYSLISGDKTMADKAYKLLGFLEEVCTKGRVLGPVGNDGWFQKGQARPADYSQQPVDVAYMVLAWVACYQFDGQRASLTNAKQWLNWFEGDNIAKQKMYQPKNLKCYDGINRGEINRHSGAESNICLLLARAVYKSRTSL